MINCPLRINPVMRKAPSEIIEIGDELLSRLDNCDICPQECHVDRSTDKLGKCKASDKARIASCNLHYGEEPPISGQRGSGTIFMSGCSLSCLYCQNYPISQQHVGEDITIEALAEKMISLQKRHAHNINFVTPDHYWGHIVKSIGLARLQGLEIPIVCNSSGYQKLETLRMLEGIIDIYLVDMRYDDNDIARNCSGAKEYKEVNRAAVMEMYRQTGNLKVDGQGIAESGVLIRHLVLPGGISGSEGIFRFLSEDISKETYVSIMSQYFPAYKAVNRKDLGRKITGAEFDNVVEMFYNAGLANGYIQELGIGSD